MTTQGAVRILATSTAHPPFQLPQEVARDQLCGLLFGPGWETRTDAEQPVRELASLFAATGVKQRQMVIEPHTYYQQRRSTGERMKDYSELAYPLARCALQRSLDEAGPDSAESITDFLVVSCTGYATPGLDTFLARDLGMRPDVRRVVVGHMGCFGAIVGLRQALAAVRAEPNARVAVLTVELCSLHYFSTEDHGIRTGYALFGDAAAAAILGGGPELTGPTLVDSYCLANFATVDQMSWHITDEGFIMGLSRRVPVSLSRAVRPMVEDLLARHGLRPEDVQHWLIHPGGPDILRVIQSKVGLSDEQLEPSWEVLAQHGNCSSVTVLIVLDRLMKTDRVKSGDWGVMMAFGPGLTIETCLLRF